MGEPRAWALLAIEGDRQYGGNHGYEDSPTELYRYDSDVANCRQVSEGDVVIIRSREAVIGLSVIDEIRKSEGPKQRQRCPICSTPNIKPRVSRRPAWRCGRGHLFDEPTSHQDVVEKFEARYSSRFIPVDGELTVAHLHAAVIRPNDQMSIKEIDLARIETNFQSQSARQIVDDHARRLQLPPIEDRASETACGSVIEARRRVLREIAARQGQARFRKRLIRRYGCACQVSGCLFPGLIEAAHITPYARTSDNGAQNGLLLRSDLHTLFDLGLLAIHPRSLLVCLDRELLAAGYEALNGVSLRLNGTDGPDRQALAERWAFFIDHAKASIGAT